jgi:metallophosphoesterase superfamily enzyme
MPSAARLRLIRDRLLRLHKVLLDAERARYEQAHGPVRSSGDMLQLVLGHEHFAWLRSYSGLIVRIDEWVAGDAHLQDEAEAFVLEADRLTTSAAAAEETPEGRYRGLIDSSAEAAMAHASVRDALSGKP